MSVTMHEVWYNYEYHRGMYSGVLERFEHQPHDPNVAYELVWAYSVADARPVPPGAEPLAAFPLECYDLLTLLPAGTLSLLPSVTVSTAIGWNPDLTRKFASEREHLVVMFKEGDGETELRIVVYLGGNQHTRFFSFATLIKAMTFLYEFWHTGPTCDHCNGAEFGTQWMRDNLILEYECGSNHHDRIEQGWNWLENM
ncbi:hypothetical protein F5876DRAFT_71137 [Lentinula aff. lateritia]|uniref:Uncharacterized protein n=1 Tax=Lentinula aff. lateritia TaxID=2804960 RepID=A0ACC1THB9_9AGAR|nr:hypothetical protein F5876DRAFT_71137 [Lentinula aff. lateritia]